MATTQEWHERIKNVSLDALISTPVGVIVGVLFAFLLQIPIWAVVLCAVLTVISIVGLRLSKRVQQQARVSSRAGFFLEQLDKIPDETLDRIGWERWANQKVALLRGRGLKRKADTLRQLIFDTDPLDCQGVARDFFHGLAEEARAGGWTQVE